MTQQSVNQLRDALEKADRNSSFPIAGGRSLISRQTSAAPSPGTMIVERLKINRVDIKIEVASFIDRHFIGRTGNDGTILELSKERLVESLTDLFYGIEENASINEDDPKPRRSRENRKQVEEESNDGA